MRFVGQIWLSDCLFLSFLCVRWFSNLLIRNLKTCPIFIDIMVYKLFLYNFSCLHICQYKQCWARKLDYLYPDYLWLVQRFAIIHTLANTQIFAGQTFTDLQLDFLLWYNLLWLWKEQWLWPGEKQTYICIVKLDITAQCPYLDIWM